MAHHGHVPGVSAGHRDEAAAGKIATVVLHLGGLGWASEKAVVQRVLSHRAGVRAVEANPGLLFRHNMQVASVSALHFHYPRGVYSGSVAGDVARRLR
jgi:hypothetical protein